jgi:neutral ceramidase
MSATSAVMAYQRLAPAVLSSGKSINKNHVFNRRLSKPDGSIIMNWIDRRELQECDYAGPVDPELGVIRFEDTEGKTIGFILNYAVHNNAYYGQEITPDFFGYTASLLSKVFGPDVVTVFLAGACGDTNWIDHKDYSQEGDRLLYRKIGTGLAGSVMEVLPRLKRLTIESIKVSSGKFEARERPYSEYDTRIDGTFGTGDEVYHKLYSDYYKMTAGKPLRKQSVEISTIALGNEVLFLTNPAELFTGYGIKLKEKSPFPLTVISELTNGYIGYIPELEDFDEGGYEVKKIHRNSFLEKDTGDRIVDLSLKLMNDIIKQDKESEDSFTIL